MAIKSEVKSPKYPECKWIITFRFLKNCIIFISIIINNFLPLLSPIHLLGIHQLQPWREEKHNRHLKQYKIESWWIWASIVECCYDTTLNVSYPNAIFTNVVSSNTISKNTPLPGMVITPEPDIKRTVYLKGQARLDSTVYLLETFEELYMNGPVWNAVVYCEQLCQSNTFFVNPL